MTIYVPRIFLKKFEKVFSGTGFSLAEHKPFSEAVLDTMPSVNVSQTGYGFEVHVLISEKHYSFRAKNTREVYNQLMRLS